MTANGWAMSDGASHSLDRRGSAALRVHKNEILH